MRLAFLTTDDPLYLPAFFDRVLDGCGGETRGVFVAPPLYQRQNAWRAAWRYFRTFGLRASFRLGLELARARANNQSIRSICRKWGVPHAEAADVNDPVFIGQVRAQSLDVLISVSCPQIFRAEIIGAARRGILNVHGAVLPRYRGVLPSFWMLANREKLGGVSVHFVDERIDGGSLCGQATFAIDPSETLHAFLRRSKQAAAELLLRVLQQLRDNSLPCCPLNLAAGSYYSWPTAADYRRFRAAGHRLF